MKPKISNTDKNLVLRRIALLAAILLSGGMLLLPRIPLLLILLIATFVITSGELIPFKSVKAIVYLLLAIFIAAIIRPGPFHVESIFIRYINFFAGFLLLAIYWRSGFSTLSKDLFAILPWMAIQALITFVLANTVPSAFSVIKVSEEGSINTILLLFNYHVTLEDYTGFNRPNGLFWEPGVFQLYLNIYLYLAIYVFKKRKDIILSIIALACVYSTTGVLITGLILISYFLSEFFDQKKAINRRTVFLFFGIIVGFGYLAFNNLQDKLLGESQGSSMIRQYDFIVGLDIVTNYPLLGIGFDHGRYDEVVQKLSLVQDILDIPYAEERTTSNGIAYLFYSLGFPLALVFMYAMFAQKLFKNYFLFGMILILSLVGEALIFTPFIIMIMFSGLIFDSRGLKKEL